MWDAGHPPAHSAGTEGIGLDLESELAASGPCCPSSVKEAPPSHTAS